MRKYGVDKFHIELIEETDNPAEREIYWINRLQTYKYGYNATLGGEGKKYIDYDLVIEKYLTTKNMAQVSRELNIHYDSVFDILHNHDIEVKYDHSQLNADFRKECKQYTADGQYIQTFKSYRDAARYLIDNNISHTSLHGTVAHISQACNKKRKHAYGFCWESNESNT